MEFTATTSDTRHSFTNDVNIFIASNKTATDTCHYLLKTYAHDNNMLSLRCEPETLIKLTKELCETSGGRLLPVSRVSNNGSVTVVYIIPDNKPVQTLYEGLRSGVDYNLKSALECILQVCDAVKVLHKMHNPGFILGFLNPDSILINKDNQVRLFNYEMSVSTDIFASDGYDKDQLFFIDPRLLEGSSTVDHFADIYSVGRILEYMLAVMPSTGEKIYSRELKNVRRIINKCVVESVETRYQSIIELTKELSDQLAACVRAGSGREKRLSGGKDAVSIAVATAVVLFLAVSVIRLAYRPSEADTRLAEARQYRDDGYFAFSEWLYLEYIEDNPQDADGYMGYARLLLENGLYERAETELMRVDEKNLKSRQKSEFSLLLGEILEENSDFHGALYHFRNAYNYDKKSVVNGLALITANIKITQRTETLDSEYISILSRIHKLTKDKAVFVFIEACAAYEAGDYPTAYELFKESSRSDVEYVIYEAYRYMMELTSSIESDTRRVAALQKEIMQMAEESRHETPLVLFLKEKYAVFLFEYANAGISLDRQNKSDMLHEAKELFAYLSERGAINPNTYIYYAEILRSDRSYELARSALNTANGILRNNINILISQIHAEYDYQKNFDNDFSQVKRLYDEAMNSYSENPAYKNEMQELKEIIRQIKNESLELNQGVLVLNREYPV